MMIADPLKSLTSDEENHNFGKAQCEVATFVEERRRRSTSSECAQASCGRLMIEGNERSRILSDFGFNPLNIPARRVRSEDGLLGQLETPAIQAHVRRLQAQLQRPASVDESLRAIFPFAHFVLTESGQAESCCSKRGRRKDRAPESALSPAQSFMRSTKASPPEEAPHPEVFRLNSREQYKGDMAWDALQAQVAQDPSAIALVCIEVTTMPQAGIQFPCVI